MQEILKEYAYTRSCIYKKMQSQVPNHETYNQWRELFNTCLTLGRYKPQTTNYLNAVLETLQYWIQYTSLFVNKYFKGPVLDDSQVQVRAQSMIDMYKDSEFSNFSIWLNKLLDSFLRDILTLKESGKTVLSTRCVDLAGRLSIVNILCNYIRLANPVDSVYKNMLLMQLTVIENIYCTTKYFANNLKNIKLKTKDIIHYKNNIFADQDIVPLAQQLTKMQLILDDKPNKFPNILGLITSVLIIAYVGTDVSLRIIQLL